MLELERNTPIEAEVLSEFFGRCGWYETDAATKLGWALAASEEWVVCKLDGQLVGFGRACRLDAARRVVFDAVVDPRLNATGLKGLIVRALAQNAGYLQEVSVFGELRRNPLVFPSGEAEKPSVGGIPVCPPGAYLGKQQSPAEEEE